jgi:hypothetical protein
MRLHTFRTSFCSTKSDKKSEAISEVERRRRITYLSQAYVNQRQQSTLSIEQERALLLCETSCFVYWGSSFWAEQAERCIAWAKSLMGVGVT